MISEKFIWYASDGDAPRKSAEERYRYIADWSARARGANPQAFDELSALLLKGGEWSDADITENEKIFKDIIGRFIGQNRLLRAELNELMPSGVVNASVFEALERFDDELRGETHADDLKETVTRVFGDFSALRDPKTRAEFAGGMTGAEGVDSVEVFGYVNFLKDCDAAVQWTLFMPALAEEQQLRAGIRVDSFEYMRLPAVRFIGVEKDLSDDPAALESLLNTLNSMGERRCGFDYDVILLHHFGKGVDTERCHAVWGRFFRAGTPVPEGMEHIDFLPQNDGGAGAPYISQFAFARFSGDTASERLHEGFDCDAMYDITRNIILGQNVPIPYPDKYWTAEVYLNGLGNDSAAYMFSVDR